MEPIYFDSPAAFRAWLDAHHATETEVLVGYYKKGTGKPSQTWTESVDQALCYGWIDGVRRSVDEERYCIRFTPRKARSIWSAVNIKRVGELTELGLMQPSGQAAFAARSEERSNVYSFEQGEIELPPEMTAAFQANDAAWTFFHAQAASYRKAALWWVISAKRDETKQKRLTTLIDDSAAGRRLSHLTRSPK